MEKYTYTVSRITTGQDEEKICSIVRSCIDVESVQASAETSSVCFSVKDKTISKDEIERKLSYALESSGYELILLEGVTTFVPSKNSTGKKSRTLSLGTAIILAAAVGLFCIMITFGICSRHMTQGVGKDTPEYVKDVIALDKFFREYSYDGIADKDFGEHLIDAYIDFSGDIYAEYYSEDELESLTQDMTGEFVGVGIGVDEGSFTLNGQTVKAIEIKSVYENSSAEEAGILVGDMITHIGIGEDAQSVTDLGYDAALDKLAGKVGTKAKFIVHRKNEAGEYEPIEYNIERRKVVNLSVKGKVCETDEKVGIITITNFDYTTPPQFCEAVDSLKAAGCEYFVIDLRNNPGGYVESIVSVVSYFLDEGDLVMTVEDRDGKVTEKYTVKERTNEQFSIKKSDIGKYKGMKLAVLVNENTASAAELFTATVRDYSLGSIVGVKTYGKGCMQRTYYLDNYGLKGALKLTTSLYFSKSHNSYHGVGIMPDVEVQLSDEAKEYGASPIPHDKDNQLQCAIENLK